MSACSSEGSSPLGASSRRKLHMRVGPSRLPLIDVARQSGHVPYCLISESSRDVECCLTSGLPLPHWSFQAGPQLLFRFSNQSLLMLALWSCGRRASVVQAQRQIHRVLLAACTSLYRIRGSSPSIDCGFHARRTSHPVAVPRTAGAQTPNVAGSALWGGGLAW